MNNNVKKNNHAWCEINVNGTTYIFNPNLDEHMLKGGTNPNYRFCLEDSSMSAKYLPYDIEDEDVY